jgi:hypothetical protein
LRQVRQWERESGRKKLFVIRNSRLKRRIPAYLAKSLILDFSNAKDFAANFFRLMHEIYQRPTFYQIAHKLVNDNVDGGYLLSLWVKCDKEFLKRVDFVEYRFDYEFNYPIEWNEDIIDSAVHLSRSRRSRFAVRELWIKESITVFVGIYLSDTSPIFIVKRIHVAQSAS